MDYEIAEPDYEMYYEYFYKKENYPVNAIILDEAKCFPETKPTK